eukprot:CAMPEP_0196686826 /NCGR_PEP_ID=MMETSP1090-20130531/13488_1 /TAXON_ID=37098 /ORGANISM="Isochrysis sp, Strain CCMP1244" /LENGTH=39 /DNA_ID= /DNA_START= /DNA_END= /DNA_ORIENTATION=
MAIDEAFGIGAPSSSVFSRRPILPQAIEEAFDIEIPDEE